MPDYDAGFKIVARHAGQALARLAGVLCDHWEPLTGEVQATERLADRVFRARRGRDKFVVYMEAYTRWQKSAPWSVLAKSGLLSEREKLPTVSLVYILLPRGYRPQSGTFQLKADGATTQQVWFHEIPLWQQQPARWWEQNPGLMALYPLCHHEQKTAQAVGRAAEAITQHTPDVVERADMLTILAIFSKLVKPQFNVVELIGREVMKQSKLYQEILAEGREEERRQAILDLLLERFGHDASLALKQSLERARDSKLLSELFRLAVHCADLPEFRRALPK